MRIAVAGGTGVVGHYVVEVAAAAGHDVVVLARSAGVDIRTGRGLGPALDGVQVIVDVANAGTSEEGPATDFFVEASANLQRLGEATGVRHLVVLSIVGIDRAPIGYYAAKLAHEHAARAGRVPVSILRATQFHEFAAQMLRRHRHGAVAVIPDLRVQTVAARAVGQALLDVADAPPARRTPDVAGPERAGLVTLAQLYAARLGLGVDVVALEPSLPPGALLPRGNVRVMGPTFDQWLAGGDAAHVGADW